MVSSHHFAVSPVVQIEGQNSIKRTIEKLQFYYHPDHLGSSSYISDISGEVYQNISDDRGKKFDVLFSQENPSIPGVVIKDTDLLPQLADKTNEVVWEGNRWGMDDVTGWVANTKSGKATYKLWKFASENILAEFDFMQFSDGSFSVTSSEEVATTLTGKGLPDNRNKIVAKWFHSHPGDDNKVLNVSGPDKQKRNSCISKEKGNLNAEIKIYAPHHSDREKRWVDFRYAE